MALSYQWWAMSMDVEFVIRVACWIPTNIPPYNLRVFQVGNRSQIACDPLPFQGLNYH